MAAEVGQVVELAVQNAFDAVQAAEDAVVQRVELVRPDHAGEACVDDGGGAA